MADHVRVFTFKEGLLSRVAHDLRLQVEPRGVSVVRTGDEVRAELDPTALVVDGAIRGTQLEVEALSRRDRAKIVETIRDEVLSTRRYPKIRFTGTVTERGDHVLEVHGELELAGVRRPLSFIATRDAGRITARVTVRPSEFGIAPYKALAGAIRLQDRVVVELDLMDVTGS
jgi:polyisoprenoid-binding protein YceI